MTALHPLPTTHIAPTSAARCAADLAWLLQSAPLLSLIPQHFSASVQRFSPSDERAIALWLTRLDAAHLHAFVAQAVPAKAAMRLGRYAERLMEYFLLNAGIFKLTAANVQLKNSAANSDHTTLGEFDYLLHDTAGKAWHWELAVKFYLCHAQGGYAEPHDFKGPAGADTLALKLGKVFNKQLVHLPPAPYDGEHWQPAAYARGWLFYPHGGDLPRCEALNPVHLRGWWLKQSDFETSEFEARQFVHLPRLQWLAPYSGGDLPVLSQADVLHCLRDLWANASIKQASAGQMLACVRQENGLWRELSRGFVVP